MDKSTLDWMTSDSTEPDYLTMVTYTADGETDQYEFNFPGGYLNKADIKAYMFDPEGVVRTDLTVEFISDNLVKLSPAQKSGNRVTIYRDTPKELPLVSFTDGAMIEARNLDRNAKQCIFAVAEILDKYNIVYSQVELAEQYANIAREAADTATTQAAFVSYIYERFKITDEMMAEINRARDDAQFAAGRAENAQDAAERARDATEALATSAGIFPSVAAGLAGTSPGQYFTVGQGVASETAAITYLNDNGTAVAVFKTAGTQSYVNLNKRFMDVFLDGTYGNALSGFVDEEDNSPLFIDNNGEVVINDINFLKQVQDIINELVAIRNVFVSESDSFIQKGGFMDDEGKLPIYFDERGDVWLGDGPVNLTQFVKEGDPVLANRVSTLEANYARLNGKFFEADEDYSQVAGFVDDEGKLPLYVDKAGDVWIGAGPVNLSEFVKNGGGGIPSDEFTALKAQVANHERAIYGTGNIICEGDSLTAGAGAASRTGYVERLRARLLPQGIQVTKRAVGGTGSASIATRQGGYVNLLTLENNSIPAARVPVNILSSTQTPITNQGGGPIKGTLMGIPGVVAATFSGTERTSYTFTRDVAGTVDTYVDPETPFIKQRDGMEGDIAILWPGRNDTWRTDMGDEVMNAVDAMVAHLTAQRKQFVVMSVLNGEYVNEYKGGPVYERILGYNNRLKYKYPEQYCEIRNVLVRAYNPSIPQDVLDFQHDIPPSSLRADNIHLLDPGYDIVEATVYNHLKNRGLVK